jgi:hypothetical protein
MIHTLFLEFTYKVVNYFYNYYYYKPSITNVENNISSNKENIKLIIKDKID